MKEIDLRNASDGDRNWWTYYLAYLASTPNNWVAQKINGLKDFNFNTQWTIVCLDGAPERVRYQIHTCGNRIQAAQRIVASAETRFAGFIDEALQRVNEEPDARILGNWRDGAIIGNRCKRTASIFVEYLSRRCSCVNAKECLPWNAQFHVRAGVGRTLNDAFSALLHARRDEVGFLIRDWWC